MQKDFHFDVIYCLCRCAGFAPVEEIMGTAPILSGIHMDPCPREIRLERISNE